MVNEDLLRTLFVKKSLKNVENGFQLQMKNSISDATIIEGIKFEIRGDTIEGKEKYKDFMIEIGDSTIENKKISEQNPANFNTLLRGIHKSQSGFHLSKQLTEKGTIFSIAELGERFCKGCANFLLPVI